MKKSIFNLSLIALLLLVSCGGEKKEKEQTKTQTIESYKQPEMPASGDWDGTGSVVYLSQDDFVRQIFDFRNEKVWKYKGKVPCVIDFYTDWCKPCKMLAPVMEELAAQYKGKIQFFKVNAEREMDLSTAFGVTAYPSIFLVPQNGSPAKLEGSLPKSELENAIEKVILSEK